MLCIIVIVVLWFWLVFMRWISFVFSVSVFVSG